LYYNDVDTEDFFLRPVNSDDDGDAVAARGQGAPGQMTWLKGFRPGCRPGFRPGCQFLQRGRIACNAERCNTYCPSVCLSVCPSVRHTPIPYTDE